MRRRLSALLTKATRKTKTHFASEQNLVQGNGEPMGGETEICIGSPCGSEEFNDIMTCEPLGLLRNIIVNHDFSEGLTSWHSNQCNAYVVSEGSDNHDGIETNSRGFYTVVTGRKESWQGLEQDITTKVCPGSLYSMSAIVRVRGVMNGGADVKATVRLENEGSPYEYIFVGGVSASGDHWEILNGSFSFDNMPERVIFYLEGPPAGVDLLIHSVTISTSSTNQHEGIGEPMGGETEICIGSPCGSEEFNDIMTCERLRLPRNIIVNHDFSEGLTSWHSNQCNAYVVSGGSDNNDGIETNSRGFYTVVTGRKESWQGLEQDITTKVCPGYLYSMSAIVRVRGVMNSGADVKATVRLENEGSPCEYIFVGGVSASGDHWEILNGSFSFDNMPERVIFYLEGPPAGVDLLIHSVTISTSSTNHHEEANTGVSADADGDIIRNSGFEDGLNCWSGRGCKILHHDSMGDGKVLPLSGVFFASATERSDSWNGIQQEITGRLQRKLAYEATAVVRIYGSASASEVRITLWVQMPDGREQYIGVAKIQASDKEWMQMQGKFLLNGSPSKVTIFLEGPPPGIDLLVNSLVVRRAPRLPPSSPPDFDLFRTSTTTSSRNLSADFLFNHEFSGGLDAWIPNTCEARVVSGESNFVKGVSARSGSNYAILCGRTDHWQGMEYDITEKISAGASYSVSAWVRVHNTADEMMEVRATLKLEYESSPANFIFVGRTLATELEWRELEGSFTLTHIPKRVIFFLEGPPAGVDLLIDSVAMYSHATSNDNYRLFGDNIIKNSTLKDGLSGWHPLGSCTLKVSAGSPHLLPPAARDTLGKHASLSGHHILCTDRTETWMGPAQDILKRLKLNMTYQVSAWVRVGSSASCPQIVNVAFDVDDCWVNGGQVYASSDKWYEIAGSFRIEKQSRKVCAYFQGPSPGVDLMVAGFHIFPVNRKARFSHLKKQTDKIRKRDVILKFPGLHGGNLSGGSVKVRQRTNSFPFGSCINRSDLDNEDFIDFFLKNFNWAVFGNELKWYHTEQEKGKLNYTDADEMLDFCRRHGVATRGHCIFWEVEDAIQQWVRCLNTSDLMMAIQHRLMSLLSRYRGQFRHYDVNNEMLHGSFYRDRLGNDIIAYMFKAARELDPSAKLFVNDYNVEDGRDAKSSPEMFIQQILDLQERGAPIDGIGLQAHIECPVGAIISSALDKLAILGLPIWFTELDVAADNEHIRADDLEVVLREAYAHPAMEGIVLWGFWEVFMYRDRAHLVNAEGDISEAGRRYLQLKQEWMTDVDGEVDANDEFRFRGFHGKYDVEVASPDGRLSRSFVVEKGESPQVIFL